MSRLYRLAEDWGPDPTGPSEFSLRRKIVDRLGAIAGEPWFTERDEGEEKGPYCRRLYDRRLWHEMVHPESRAFFHACRDALSHLKDRGVLGKVNEEGLRRWLDPGGPLEWTRFRACCTGDPDLIEVFRAHLLLVERAARSRGWGDNGQVTESVSAAVAEETRLPLGQVRDVAEALVDRERPGLGASSMPVLLFDRRDGRGVLANLVVEVVPDGRGEVYPAPEVALVGRASDFRAATDEASACVRNHWKLGWDGFDVRWTLTRRGKVRSAANQLHSAIGGPSASAAFATLLGNGLATLRLGAKGGRR